jgi:peptide/nickel transport system substrate-binding protein
VPHGLTLRALAATALIVLAACVPTRHIDVASAPNAVLRLAIGTDPHSLNPLLSQSIPENEILRLMHDPLVACDAAGRPVPALALVVPSLANRGISGDGRTITYHLRPGVLWHDGTPFTSADVTASFRAVMDPRSVVQSRHGYDVVARVETPDPLTVRFRLKRPFAPFVGTVFAESDAPYYLAPAHLVRDGLARSSLANKPVGTGPYKLARWARGDRIELEANDTYWGGKPTIRRIVVRVIPDENTQLVGLRSGDLDGIIQLSANAAALAKGMPKVRVATSPLNAYWGVMMNNAPGHATSDRRVRRAIAEAVNAEAFRLNVTHGLYAPAVADLPVTLWAANPLLKPIGFDPGHARRLLAEAGYGKSHRLALDLAVLQSSQTHRAESVALQSALRAIDVDVRIHAYLGNVFDAPPSEGGILTRGRYDLALYGWFAGMDPDDSGQFMCDQRPPAGYNHSFYCDADMDAAQRVALASYDDDERRRAYARIQGILLRDVPIAFLGSPVAVFAVREDLDGYSPTLVTQTANAQRWSLPTTSPTP